MKKLPSVIYVWWNEEDEEPYLTVSENPKDAAKENDAVHAGAYHLHTHISIANETRVVPKKSGR